jgi:hypothetical protein
VIARALISGGVAAIATTLVAALAGRRATGSYAAPLNATSHFLWGDVAARKNPLSLKYTGVGLAANAGACVFWAVFYESLGKRRALRNGALVSGLAYVTDYYLVPRRLTPGFELRLGRGALFAIYAALAVGLSGRDVYARLVRKNATVRSQASFAADSL